MINHSIDSVFSSTYLPSVRIRVCKTIIFRLAPQIQQTENTSVQLYSGASDGSSFARVSSTKSHSIRCHYLLVFYPSFFISSHFVWAPLRTGWHCSGPSNKIKLQLIWHSSTLRQHFFYSSKSNSSSSTAWKSAIRKYLSAANFGGSQ